MAVTQSRHVQAGSNINHRKACELYDRVVRKLEQRFGRRRQQQQLHHFLSVATCRKTAKRLSPLAQYMFIKLSLNSICGLKWNILHEFTWFRILADMINKILLLCNIQYLWRGDREGVLHLRKCISSFKVYFRSESNSMSTLFDSRKHGGVWTTRVRSHSVKTKQYRKEKIIIGLHTEHSVLFGTFTLKWSIHLFRVIFIATSQTSTQTIGGLFCHSTI